MAAIDISSTSAPLATGLLQLQNGVAMDSTLRNVADQSNTTSPLKLSTSGVQVASTLQITTNSNPYIDAEDGAGNNRFQVGRDPSSQVVNIDFASNPTGGTNQVGAIRTYTDGVNLAEVMSFRKDGYIGIGTTTPTENLQVQGNVFSGGGTKLVLTGESFALQTIVASGAGGMVIGTNANNPSFIDILSANQFFHISNRASSNRLGIYSATYVGTTATYSSELLTLTTGGSLGIGETAPTARVQIKGSGSTSATSALVVQNSSASELFKIRDDGAVGIGGAIYTGWKLSVQGDIKANRIDLYGSTGGGHAMAKIDDNGTLMRNNTFAIDGGTGNAGQQANLAVGEYFSTLARLYIKGSGSTSATTSLLVQNSSGSTALTIKDDLSTIFNGSSAGANFAIQNSDVTGYSGIEYLTNTGSVAVFTGYRNGGTGEFRFNNVATNGFITFKIASSDKMTIANSGNIGIGTTSPNASSLVDMTSTTQGFLPPRMTNAQRAAIATPAIGLMVYCTDAVEGLYIYKSTGWTFVI